MKKPDSHMSASLRSVTASAPGKLMLSVGYAVVHGYSTVVTAVGQRLKATVTKNGSGWFHLQAPDLGLTQYSKEIARLGTGHVPKSVQFIEIFYKHFLEKYPQKEGISVLTDNEFSASYGFGSSSAVTVAFAHALLTLYDIQISQKELFDLTYRVILEVQGVGSGYDLASAIWGGTLRYVKPAKVVQSIDVKDLPLMVVYTGEKADTPTLVRLVDSHYEQEPERIGEIFKEIDTVALELEGALKESDWKKVGELFRRSQQTARELGVSSTRIEELVGAAEGAGAYGATCSGAAGGDCVLISVDESKKAAVEQALTAIGAPVLSVPLNAEGVKIEKQEKSS
jgi:mevalonate kinase